MKKLILITFVSIFGFLSMMGQCAKYDGDWYYTKSSRYVDPDGVWKNGTYKSAIRIKTIEGKTNLFYKVKYPYDDDFTYFNCQVTTCNESSLDWNATVNDYYVDNLRYVILCYCSLSYNSGALLANFYYVQQTYNRSGTLIDSKRYTEENYTLYKDNNDW